jgi:hypothetical protein
MMKMKMMMMTKTKTRQRTCRSLQTAKAMRLRTFWEGKRGCAHAGWACAVVKAKLK